MQALWTPWLQDVEPRGVFAPSMNHDCRLSKCPLRQIPLYRCDQETLCMGPSPPTMGWYQRNIVFLERGGQPMCPMRQHPHVPVPAFDASIYFCSATGTPHFCGRQCNSTTVNRDGGIVCTLTGLEIEERRVTTGLYGDADNWVSRVRKDTKEMTNETLVSRALDFVGNTTRIPRLEKNFGSFWAHAIIHITGILSPQRFAHEDEELAKRTDGLHTLLERHMGNRRHSVDFLQLLLVAIQHRKKFATTMRISMNEDITKRLAPHYAAIILGLWGVLRTLVPGGDQVTKKSAFKDFILAGLELYRTGISVRDRMDQYDVILLSPDPILSIVGISDHAKEIALDSRVSNKNIARLRKGILTLLQDSITIHSVSPECLRICEAATKNTHLPPEVFE